MNDEHPNISILKKLDLTNIAGCNDILTADMVWHYINPKLPDVQGDYVGLKGFQSFFERMGGLTGGTFKVNPIAITPMGDKLVITHVKDTMVLDGRQMELEAVVVWCIVDGKIVEAWDIPIIHTAKDL